MGIIKLVKNTINTRFYMFKYLSLLALCALPIIAADQQNIAPQPMAATEEADAVQPLAQSIALIMADLEKGIRMLDSPLLKDPRAAEIIEHLINADTSAQEQLIKLIALLKIKKLEEAGMTVGQLQQFAKTFTIFHTKLCAFKKEVSFKATASEDAVCDSSETSSAKQSPTAGGPAAA